MAWSHPFRLNLCITVINSFFFSFFFFSFFLWHSLQKSIYKVSEISPDIKKTVYFLGPLESWWCDSLVLYFFKLIRRLCEYNGILRNSHTMYPFGWCVLHISVSGFFFFFFFQRMNSKITWIYCVKTKITVHTQ